MSLSTLSAARGGQNPVVEAASSGIGGMPSYFLTSFYPVEAGGGGAAVGTVVPAADRAPAASTNHREAEKRRRERIKSDLDRLRTLLVCDPKTDKASLLAKVVEHVRDLKRRTAEIAETARLLPTEADEIVVLAGSDGGRRPVFEATVRCDDRSDLLRELIETLRSLGTKPVRAEIATLGGRVRNVVGLPRETDDHCMEDDGSFLKDALDALVNRQSGSPDRSKRRRIRDPAVA